MPVLKELIVVRVEHEYFDDCYSKYYELVLTGESKQIMHRRGVVMKERNDNSISLLAEENNFGFFDDDILQFEFRVKDNHFLLYTEMGGLNMFRQYTLRCKSGINDVVKSLTDKGQKRIGGLFLVEIPLNVNYTKEVVLRFKTKLVRWGYLIISDENKTDDLTYHIVSNDDSISFQHPMPIDIPWQFGEKGLLIASSRKIPLKARNNQKMILFETDNQRPNHKRIIQKNIDPPVIGEVLTKDISKDMVVSLLYV
ncbi:MAG: hypothetical protein IK017_08135 [Paludibacteraceae bacterium]|nr:hypothetical protein [Paludibacteraceae bacterium]MBR5972606.1 hypothetical protein [Paludibacteraceae bacterium]